MVMIDILYSLFPLLFIPRITNTYIVKNVKYPLASISCSHNVCQLFGAILCTLVAKKFSLAKFLPFSAVVNAVSQCSIALFYENKTITFICLCFVGLSDGCICSILLGFRKEIYRPEIRTRIMGLIKFFSAIVASAGLMVLKKYPSEYTIGVSGISAALSAVISIFFALSTPSKEEKKKTD